MEETKIYDLNMTNCDNYWSSMCKVRTGDFRDCVLARCCSICNKRFDDPPCLCKKMIDEWKIKNNYKED